LGPGAGEHGGSLLFAGPRSELLQSRESLTARYLNGELRIPVPTLAAQTERAFFAHLWRARAQSAEHRSDDSAADAGRDHGRFGIGKIHAGARRDLQGARSAARGRNVQELCDRIEGDSSFKAWFWWTNLRSGARRDRIPRPT
jgi:hypothetical protein